MQPSTRARLALLLLWTAGTLLALRENSIGFTLQRIAGRLRIEALGAGMDLGALPPGAGLALTNVGPEVRRSPACLIRRSGLVLESMDLLLACRHDAQGNQLPLVLGASELDEGPVALRVWNPFRTGIEVGVVGGSRLVLFRFHVPEGRLTSEAEGRERSTELRSPFARLVVAGLLFALLSAAALVSLVRLLWSLGDRPVRLESGGRSGWAAPAVAFAVGAVAVGYVHFMVYKQQPAFGDEINYLVQARILAAGHVSLPRPRDAEFFTVDWMDLVGSDGKMWDFHPIGHSGLLALGFLLGSPSLVPVLVGGGVFAALFAIARRLAGSRVAWLAVLTAAGSQLLVTLAASFMAHASALLFIALSMLALLVFVQEGRERALIAAGACLGAAFLMRPISAVLVALVPAAVLARRKLPRHVLLLAVLAAAALASLEPLRTWLSAGRFTLGYLAKGPETGGLSQILSQPWEWRAQNLYLNYRYYHDRVFGLGILGNLLFFFVPLVAGARAAWVRLSYVVVLVYWMAHSLLHFYGWKWEPRMLLEITHLTILLTAYGLWLVVTGCRPEAPDPRRALTALAACLVGGFLAWNLVRDLPDRLRHEYAGYNSADTATAEAVRAQGIHDAVLLYDDATLGFAPHLPENAIRRQGDGRVAFEGDLIHAIHLGTWKDQALLSRYPERRAFRVRAPGLLEELPAFYSHVVPRVAELIRRRRESRPVAVGVPWLRYVQDRRVLEPLGADRLFDDEGFFAAFAGPARPTGPELVVGLGEMKGHARALLEMFEGAREVESEDVGIPLSLVWIDPARRRTGGPQPGLRRSVARGVRCDGDRLESGRAGIVSFDATGLRDVCAEWSGEFRIDAPATYVFATTSDDGSGLAIDDRLVVRNALYESQGRTRREGSVDLAPGTHRLKLTYSQFSGPAWMEAEVRKGGAPFAPLGLASFDGVVHADDAAQAPPPGAPPPVPVPTPQVAVERRRAVAPASREPPGPRVDPQLLRLSSFRAEAPELAARANDGKAETRWDTGRPQSGGEWLRIDLVRPVRVDRLTLETPAFPEDYPRRLRALVSPDGNDFQPAAIVVEGRPFETEVRFEHAVSVCSLRLEQLGSDPVYYWSVHELALWGSPASGSCRGVPIVEPTPTPAAPPPPPAPPSAPRLDSRELRASSSRADDPELAEMAIDGLQGTRWDTGRPQAAGDWFRIDLPDVGELHAIRLETDASPEDYPRQLQVGVSEDGVRFQPAASLRGSGPVTELRFDPPIRCRAVRLDQTGEDPRYFWSIQEAVVFGHFPKRPRSWLDAIPHPKAWLALIALLGVSALAVRAGRAPGIVPPPDPDSPEAARRFKLAAGVALFCAAAALLASQADYGETWDEFEHFANGEEHYQYIFGSGVVPPLFGHAFRKFYGPFSDTVAAVLRHVLHDRLGWMSVEAAVHVHLLALFVLGGAVAFSVIRREHGGRAALVCLVAFLLNPHLIGHCHNNMKDFAVTAWMVIAAFAFHAAQSRGSYPGLALAGLVSGMAMATKINGLLLIPLLVGHAVLFVAVERSRPRVRFAVLGGLVHWAVALASMVLFWPWLWDAPLSRLLRGTRFFQNLWLGPVLYEGRIFNAKELPWEYAITFVVITTPLCLLPFAALGAARVAPALRARRLLPALALAAFLLVMAVATLAPVPRYDGVRHFLPAFPFLACLSGFGLAFVLERPERSGARLLATALVVGVLGCVLYQDVRLHPYQATYFNQLVGGGAGAMGRFELDYWGSSLKEAGRWVNQHAPTGSRVHVVLDLERLARLRPDLTPTAASPDYAIVLARESLAPNPYRDRTPDYAVVADGAVLARVYRLGPR